MKTHHTATLASKDATAVTLGALLGLLTPVGLLVITKLYPSNVRDWMGWLWPSWILIPMFGVPAAVLGFIVGGSAHKPLQRLLTNAPRDPAVPFPLRIAARIVLAGMSLGTVIAVLLFGGLLLTAHTAAAWIVASYLISVYAVRSFLTHGVVAVNSAARRSEPHFLFALSQGLCGLRDKATNEFIGAKPWEPKS